MTDLDRLLDFAARSRLPDGGFGYLGSDGRVVPDRPVETWIVARMTHVFGLAHLLGRPGAEDLVRHGVAALTDGPLHDAEHGGWRSSTDDDTKAAYVHAFVVLAGATATTAGVDGGRALLDEALAVWQTRFWDDDAGLAVEEWDRGLDAVRGLPRRQRQHARRRGRAGRRRRAGRRPATAARLRDQALRSTERVVHGWARERRLAAARALHRPTGRRCTTTTATTRRTRSAPTASRSGTSSNGPAWPCTSASVLDDPPAWLLDDALALFDAAATRGWAADGRDGFPYTLDWDDRPVVGARMHWVLCEAVAAATVLAAVTGEQRYRDLAARWREHGETHFADSATGSWHHELTPDGDVATGTWSGQPDAYHLAQMLLLAGRPVRGSIAAALR